MKSKKGPQESVQSSDMRANLGKLRISTQRNTLALARLGACEWRTVLPLCDDGTSRCLNTIAAR